MFLRIYATYMDCGFIELWRKAAQFVFTFQGLDDVGKKVECVAKLLNLDVCQQTSFEFNPDMGFSTADADNYIQHAAAEVTCPMNCLLMRYKHGLDNAQVYNPREFLGVHGRLSCPCTSSPQCCKASCDCLT